MSAERPNFEPFGGKEMQPPSNKIAHREKEKTEPVIKKIIDFLNSQDVLKLSQRQLGLMFKKKFGINNCFETKLYTEDVFKGPTPDTKGRSILEKLTGGNFIIIEIDNQFYGFPNYKCLNNRNLSLGYLMDDESKKIGHLPEQHQSANPQHTEILKPFELESISKIEVEKISYNKTREYEVKNLWWAMNKRGLVKIHDNSDFRKHNNLYDNFVSEGKNELQGEIKELNTKLKLVELEIEKITNQLAKLKDEMEKIPQTVSSLQQNLSDKQKLLAELEGKNFFAKLFQAKNRKETEEDISDLEVKIKNQKDRESKISEEIKEHSGKLSELEKEDSEFKQEIQEALKREREFIKETE